MKTNNFTNRVKPKIDWKNYILILMAILIIISISFNIYFYQLVNKKNENYIYSVVQFENISTEINSIADLSNVSWSPYLEQPILIPELDSEMAGENGNLYAPEIIYEDNIYKMWYGAQNDDGHDQIHYAVSHDGVHWQKVGVAIPNNNNNHVNDPSVVKVNGTYYMFYTTAITAENDVISLATSKNGLNWTIIGNVFMPSAVGNWDSFKVGRPSVIYEDNMFKMWYDGMEADPNDPSQIKSGTGRHVGFATSYNGINWTRYDKNPIFLNGGAVDVEKIGGQYLLVEESGQGTLWGYGNNETDISIQGFLFNKTNLAWDKFGHVTPFILKINGTIRAIYVGVTTDKCWCQNRIGVWYPHLKINLLNKNKLIKFDNTYMLSPSRIAYILYKNNSLFDGSDIVQNESPFATNISVQLKNGTPIIKEDQTIYYYPYAQPSKDKIYNLFILDRQNLDIISV
ncbi:MAG: hypothetical protein ACTSU2_08290 [Promethearchaeota archaeon]